MAASYGTRTMGKQNTTVWTMDWILISGGSVYIAVCASLQHHINDEGRSDQRGLPMAPRVCVGKFLKKEQLKGIKELIYLFQRLPSRQIQVKTTLRQRRTSTLKRHSILLK